MAVTIIDNSYPQERGIKYTRITDSSSDWTNVPNSTYFYDLGDGLLHFRNSSGDVLDLFSESSNLYTANGTLTGDRTVDLAGSNLSTSDTSNAGTAKIVLDSGEAFVVDRTFNGYTANFQSSGVTHTSLGDSVSAFGSNTLRLGSSGGDNGLVIQGDRVRYYTTVDSAGDIHDIHSNKFNIFGGGFSSPANSYFSVGSFSRIGSEDISLQGNTLLNARVNIPNLPTSAAGLATGDLWNNGGVVRVGTTAVRELKDLSIGGWDLHTGASTRSVSHGLSATEWKTVRGMGATIINDADDDYQPLTSFGLISLNSTSFDILIGSSTAAYNDASVNRGFISFSYVPD